MISRASLSFIPRQFLAALIPIFITRITFAVVLLPLSSAQSRRKNAKTRVKTSIKGTSCGLSESKSRRSRVQRFHKDVPLLSTSPHLEDADLPRDFVFGKIEICLWISSKSIPCGFEDAAGSWSSTSFEKATRA